MSRVGGGNSSVFNIPITIIEVKDVPPTPPVGEAKFFIIKDNDSNKYQLCVIFPTGAVQILSTEP